MPLVLAGICTSNAVAHEDSCELRSGVRHTIGPVSILDAMRRAVRPGDGVFFDNGSFSTETFKYLGQIERALGRSWHIALLETIWGCSGRSTARLLIFSSTIQYLGQYSHFSPRLARIDGQSIVFDDAVLAHGSKIEFTAEGPPPRVLIDGDVVAFYE